MGTTREDIVINGTDKTKRMISSVRSGLKKVATAAGAATAAAAAVGAALVRSSLEAGDRVQKLAISTGLSTEALSEMQHVAKIVGTDFETLAKSNIKLQRSFAEARDGMATYADAFKKANINLEEFAKLDPDQQFEVFGEALSRIPDQADRMQVAMDVLGRGGADVIRVFEDGAGTFRNLREEAKELGLSLSRDQVDAMANANDAIVRMKASANALGNEMAVNLAPVIVDVANWLQVHTKDAIEIASRAWNGFQGMLSIVADSLANLVKGLQVLTGFTFPEMAAQLANAEIALRNTAKMYSDLANDIPEATVAVEEYTRSVGESKEQMSALSDEFDNVIDKSLQLEEIEVTAKKISTGVKEMKDEAKEADQAFGDFAQSAIQDFTDLALRGGDLEDVLINLAERFIELQFSGKGLGGGGTGGGGTGGGGFFETLLSVGSSILGAFGFGGTGGGTPVGVPLGGGSSFAGYAANGLDFMVAGAGGTDSQNIFLKATPGERVRVETPSQQRRESRGPLIGAINFLLPPDARDIPIASQQQAAAVVGTAVRRAVLRNN